MGLFGNRRRRDSLLTGEQSAPAPLPAASQVAPVGGTSSVDTAGAAFPATPATVQNPVSAPASASVQEPAANPTGLYFDSPPEPVSVRCRECGAIHIGTDGIVMCEGRMLARYRSYADVVARVVRFEVSFGPFGDDGSAGETFGVRFGATDAGVGFRHCHPMMGDLWGAGRPVPEEEARAHADATVLWQVADFLYMAEPVMRLATRQFSLPRTVEELRGA